MIPLKTYYVQEIVEIVAIYYICELFEQWATTLDTLLPLQYSIIVLLMMIIDDAENGFRI